MKLAINLTLLLAIVALSACSQPATDATSADSPDASASVNEEPPAEAGSGGDAVADADEDENAASLPGLAVGAKAPEFALKDQNGQERKLSDLLSQGSVALVFYRSADW